MRTVPGNVEHPTVFGTQLHAVPFAVRWRFRSEIQDHVEHRTSGASNQLGLERGCFLKVHAAGRAFLKAEAHIRLHGQEIDTVLGKFPRAPSSHEPSAIILMRTRIDHLRTNNAGLCEPHFIVLLTPTLAFHPGSQCPSPPLAPAKVPASMDTCFLDKACGRSYIAPDIRLYPK